MDPMAAGLRYRLRRAARHMREQHRHLGKALRALLAGLNGGDRDELSHLLVQYRTAIDAHFALEDDVFFPALHGLHPEHAQELEALSLEHRAFVRELEHLRAHLEQRDLGAFEAALGGLRQELERHESREEFLARQLAELEEARDRPD